MWGVKTTYDVSVDFSDFSWDFLSTEGFLAVK